MRNWPGQPPSEFRTKALLTDLRPAGAQPQLPTFSTAHEDKHIVELLEDVMDKFSVESIGIGRAGMTTATDWSMKRAALSPRYTTEWDELLVVKAA